MNSPSTFASIRFRLVGVLGCVFLLTAYPLTAMVSPQPASVNASTPLHPVNLSASTLVQSDKPHTLAGTYYSLQDNRKASITLNNKGLVPLEVQATLFSMAGKRLDVPPVTVDATSFRVFDLSEWASPGGPSFQQGSLQLFYRGKDLLLGAQIKIIDPGSSLIFDEQLSEPSLMVSSRLEGLWWRSTPNTQVSIAISNTTDSVQVASLGMDGNGPSLQASKDLSLQPHQTVLIDPTQDLSDGKTVVSDTGGVSIRYSGKPGSVFARAMIQNPATGFSSAIQFTDPGKAKSSSLHGAGLRLKATADEEMTLRLVARNIAETTSLMRSRICYTRSDGSRGVMALGKVLLSPGEVRAWEPKEAALLRRTDIISAGLEFDYSTEPGSILVSALSVSRSGNQVFQIPLLDAKAQKSSTGVYPFYLDYGYSTVIYIKNTTPVDQKYVAHFNYEGGKYMIGVRNIAAGETAAIDIRALRDKQVADEEGRTIPLDVERGQARWTIILEEGTDLLAMIGRSELVNEARSISSTYACQNCCGDDAQGDFITPELTQLQVGQSVILQAFEERTDCYGFPYTVQRSASWSSDNQSVATVTKVSSGGKVTSMGAGQVTIRASWQSLNTEPMQCGGPYGAIPNLPAPIPCCTSWGHFGSASATVAVAPKINSISPARGLQGVAYGVTITGAGFRSPASVTAAGTGIAVSEVHVGSSTEIIATFTVAGDAAGGNHAVTVTVSGQTSNSVNFYVQIPTKLRRDSITALQNQQGGCGATKTLEYTLLDQAGQIIADDLTVREVFSDFTSTPAGLPPPTPRAPEANAGHLVDTIGYEIPTCPPPFTVSVTQTFTVTVGQTTYNLTTTNSVSYGRDASGNKFVTVTNTVP
jgi:hypothetical protein